MVVGVKAFHDRRLLAFDADELAALPLGGALLRMPFVLCRFPLAQLPHQLRVRFPMPLSQIFVAGVLKLALEARLTQPFESPTSP